MGDAGEAVWLELLKSLSLDAGTKAATAFVREREGAFQRQFGRGGWCSTAVLRPYLPF
jgi:hypothetical protein